MTGWWVLIAALGALAVGGIVLDRHAHHHDHRQDEP